MANPTGKGGFTKGQSGNPSGTTTEAQQARLVLEMRLDGPEYQDAFLVAYLEQLKEGNATILKDYADRKLGKPVERHAMTNAEGKDVYPEFSGQQLLEVIDALKGKP